MAVSCYYIQDTRAQRGDCALFERAGRLGYTTNLSEAGLFSESEANAIVSGGQRRRWSKEELWAASVVHVSRERLDRIHREGGVFPEPKS